MNCKRGDIYYVNLGEKKGQGCIQSGVRPVVVISNNKANEHSQTITVVPLTSRVEKKKYLPTHVQIPLEGAEGLLKPSMALGEQVMPLDKRELAEYVGEVTDESVMDQITVAVQIQIGVFSKYN